MDTVTEQLQNFAADLRRQLDELVRNHSSLYLSNPPDSRVLIVAGNHRWADLSPEGRRIQARLLEEYNRFCSILQVLLRGLPRDRLRSYADWKRTVLSVIQQDGSLWDSHKEEPLSKASESLDAQVRMLLDLYANDEKPVLVPDTNALLYHPALESWAVPELKEFTVLLTPTVLSELDRLKVEHKNESVRKRAEKLVRQIKEYRRRGSLNEGVPLTKEVSRIRAMPVEPDLEATLPWLDSTNNDDRILASTIEVMRSYPRSPVILVTRDLNLQNKAEFAKIAFIEPPDPN